MNGAIGEEKKKEKNEEDNKQGNEKKKRKGEDEDKEELAVLCYGFPGILNLCSVQFKHRALEKECENVSVCG